jgi:hypothetical protein
VRVSALLVSEIKKFASPTLENVSKMELLAISLKKITMTPEKSFHSGSQVMQLELFQRLVGQLRAKGVQYSDLYSSWSTPVDRAYWERG